MLSQGGHFRVSDLRNTLGTSSVKRVVDGEIDKLTDENFSEKACSIRSYSWTDLRELNSR